MNKKIQYVMLMVLFLGLLISSISRMFSDSLTDFALGFCQGFSLVFIVSGFIYVCRCFAKKKNPFNKIL